MNYMLRHLAVLGFTENATHVNQISLNFCYRKLQLAESSNINIMNHDDEMTEESEIGLIFSWLMGKRKY